MINKVKAQLINKVYNFYGNSSQRLFWRDPSARPDNSFKTLESYNYSNYVNSMLN